MNVSDIMAEAVLSNEKSCPVAQATCFVFVAVLNALLKKVKRKIIRCSVRCFMLRMQTNSRLRNTICFYFN